MIVLPAPVIFRAPLRIVATFSLELVYATVKPELAVAVIRGATAP
jgi:hypothetical protein